MQAVYGHVSFAGPQGCVRQFAMYSMARGSHLCVGLEVAGVVFSLGVSCRRPGFCAQATPVRLVTGAGEIDR